MPINVKLSNYNSLPSSTNSFIQRKKGIFYHSKQRKKKDNLIKLFNFETANQEKEGIGNLLIGYINPRKLNFKSSTWEKANYKNNKSYDSANSIKKKRNMIKSPKIIMKSKSNPNLPIKLKKKVTKCTLPSSYLKHSKNHNLIFKKKNNYIYINNHSRNIRNFILEKFDKDKEKMIKDKNKNPSSITNYIRVNTLKIWNSTQLNNTEKTTDNNSKGIKNKIKKQKIENNIFLDKNYQKNRFHKNNSKSFYANSKIINDIFTNEKQEKYYNFIVKKKNLIIVNEKNDSNDKNESWVCRLYNNEIKKNKIKKQLIFKLRKSLLKNNPKSKKLNKTENQIDDINERWLNYENYFIEDYCFFDNLNKKNENIFDQNKKINNNDNSEKKNLNTKSNIQKIINHKKSFNGKKGYKNRKLRLFVNKSELINEEDEEKENEDIEK